MFIKDSDYNIILKSVPIICVDLLIIYKKKCLLVKRDNQPAIGQYWFPGGRILKHEYIKDAAIRKAKDETNLDCEFVKQISIEETMFEKSDQMITDIHTVNICCELSASNIDSIRLDKFHTDCIWVSSLSSSYHNAVNHPLSIIGFKFD
jgi:colanic acid biosynthesis protein WcaH